MVCLWQVMLLLLLQVLLFLLFVARRCEQRQHNSNERRYYSRNLSREDLLALKRLHDNIEDEVNSDNSATGKVEEIYKSFQSYIFTSLRGGSHYEAIQGLESDKNYLYAGKFEEQKLQLIKDCLAEVVLELEDGKGSISHFVQEEINSSPGVWPTNLEIRFHFPRSQSDTEYSSMSSSSNSALSM